MADKILAIHGAYSSPHSFDYLKNVFNNYEWVFIDYSDLTTDFGSILDRAKTIADKLDPNDNYHVIGHSIGGLIALNLSEYKWVKSITTISSPIGGMEFNLPACLLSTSSIPWDITYFSKYIKHIKNSKYDSTKIQHIVTTSGFNPFYRGVVNDCVVTLWSQTNWTCGQVNQIPLNHFEVLMNDQTVTILKNYIK